MAFDKTPNAWFENWAEDGTIITVPIATFPELTAAEADGSTGDIRKIAFALIEKLYQQYLATATADRPKKLTLTKTATMDTVRNVITHRYSISVETEIDTQEVRVEASNTPSHTVSHTPSHTVSSTPSHTVSSTPSHTVSHTPSHTASNTPSSTPSHTASHTPSHTVSNTPSHTVSPSAT